MGESAEELYAELADAARALLEAEAACNAVLAREHLSSELSEAIGRTVKARDELWALLERAPTRPSNNFESGRRGGPDDPRL